MGQTHIWMNETSSRAVPVVDSPLYAKVRDMLTEQRNGTVAQIEIDKYLLATWFEWTGQATHPRIDLLNLPQKCILTHEHMPDIGSHVRNIVMRKTPSDTFGKLIQFSMPYIKHNRLSFPAYTEDVKTWTTAALQITLGMLLGLFSEKLRKPTWDIRVRIYGTLYTLLTHGNHMDLYLFCVDNLSLLRLAVIEYYCFFVTKNMPAEMLVQSVQLEGANHSTLRHIVMIVNQFRQENLQQDKMEWQTLNAKAQQSIEKCNRCCKNKYKLDKHASSTSVFDEDIILKSMQIPRFHHATYSQHLDTFELHKIKCIHDAIKINTLPFNIVKLQVESVRNVMLKNSNSLLQSIFLFFCLNCHTTEVKQGYRTSVLCAKCNSRNSVIKVNTLGRLVQVCGTSFYYCQCCNRVHAWTGSGSEFYHCPHATSKVVKCYMCLKTHGIVQWNVMDTKLGCMQTIHMCHKHSPLEYMRPYVKTIEEFVTVVKEKKLNKVML